MKKVVIFARVSTERNQDYQRQINELTEYCSKVGWDPVKIFANKISGAKKGYIHKAVYISALSRVKTHVMPDLVSRRAV